jgi:hypothetical protein
MQQKDKFGIVFAVVGIIAGLVALYIFATSYNFMIQVENAAGRPDEANVVKLVFPLLGYIATAGTALWGVALFGFASDQKWAWITAVTASTLHLLAGFFPTIPAMSRGETPLMMALFVPSLVLWVGLMFLRKVDWKIVSIAFTAGLAMVLTFMNGVATIDKIQLTQWAIEGKPLFDMPQLPIDVDILNGMYVMVQQVNWWSTAAWAAFIYALLGKKTWVVQVGVFAGLMGLIGGLPLTVSNMLEVKRFSMFLPAPAISFFLVILLATPFARKRINDWVGAGRQEKEHPSSGSSSALAGANS